LADELAREELPIELLLGVKYRPIAGLMVSLGFGGGLSKGVGTPDWRGFLGVAWASPRRAPETDRDGDGIVDGEDDCPDQPEDVDGWRDGDGCADTDNDEDTLPDLADDCPLELEDVDGWNDSDGCFDPDNDGDGIFDVQDACPLGQEDRDGWRDGDGCPDPDNDGDGLVDERDECPDQAEVYNALDDRDGCPDRTARVELSCDRLVLREPIRFDGASAGVDSVAAPVLDDITAILLLRSDLRPVRVEVAVFAEDFGVTGDLALAQRRAESVAL
jgi:hypothetical protein